MAKLTDTDVAIFSRNHRKYLEGAETRGKSDPSWLTVFRSGAKWATAEREIARLGPLPIYLAAIGGFVQTADRLSELFLARAIVKSPSGAAVREGKDRLKNSFERLGQVDFDLFHDDSQSLLFRAIPAKTAIGLDR